MLRFPRECCDCSELGGVSSAFDLRQGRRPIRRTEEAALDPDRLARRAKRILQVLFYRDDWYRFDTTHYRKISQSTLDALVHDIIKREIDRNSLLDNRDRAVKITRHLLADVSVGSTSRSAT